MKIFITGVVAGVAAIVFTIAAIWTGDGRWFATAAALFFPSIVVIGWGAVEMAAAEIRKLP